MNLNDILKIALQNMAQHGKTSSLGGLAIGVAMSAILDGRTVTGLFCLSSGLLLIFFCKDTLKP